MDTGYVTVVGCEPAASFLRWLPLLSLLSVIESGCVSGRPSTVRVQVGRAYAARESDNSAAACLKVTTFNVWGLPSWINGASSKRYGKITHELSQLGSDVVLLQEVWTRRSFDVLSEQFQGAARTWWTASARRKGGFLGQNGLLTLSRYPIEGSEVKHFSASRLPDSLMNKGALKVTISIRPGQRVNIWNVHLQEGASGRVRSRQIAELVRWIEETDDGQIADIVGGDFNFTPESGEFRQFVAVIGPSVYQLAREVETPTWDGLRSAREAGRALDHIFVRMKQPAAEIHARPQRIFAASRREDRFSDHMGIAAFLTFTGSEEKRPAILVVRTVSPMLPETSTLMRR